MILYSPREAMARERLLISPFVMELLETDSRIVLHSGIKEDMAHTYCTTRNHICVSFGLPTTEHQISHMVEMRDFSRLTKANWGLANYSHGTEVKNFFAGLAREVRVRAIGRCIPPLYVGEKTLMHNPVWANMAKRHLPLGRFHSMQDLDAW